MVTSPCLSPCGENGRSEGGQQGPTRAALSEVGAGMWQKHRSTERVRGRRAPAGAIDREARPVRAVPQLSDSGLQRKGQRDGFNYAHTGNKADEKKQSLQDTHSDQRTISPSIPSKETVSGL